MKIERTMRVKFWSSFHGAETVMTVKGTDLTGYDYELTDRQMDRLHMKLCGCGFPPTCELWNHLEHDLDGYLMAGAKLLPHG